jgi:hypothetical protein
VDDIQIDFGEIVFGGMDWIHHAQNRDHWRTLVIAVINLLIPKKFGMSLSICVTGGLSSAPCS